MVGIASIAHWGSTSRTSRPTRCRVGASRWEQDSGLRSSKSTAKTRCIFDEHGCPRRGCLLDGDPRRGCRLNRARGSPNDNRARGSPNTHRQRALLRLRRVGQGGSLGLAQPRHLPLHQLRRRPPEPRRAHLLRALAEPRRRHRRGAGEAREGRQRGLRGLPRGPGPAAARVAVARADRAPLLRARRGPLSAAARGRRARAAPRRRPGAGHRAAGAARVDLDARRGLHALRALPRALHARVPAAAPLPALRAVRLRRPPASRGRGDFRESEFDRGGNRHRRIW